MEQFLARRKRLAERLQNNSVVILPANKPKLRTSSAHYPFRQNNDFFYLTGYKEADAVMVFSKDHTGNIKYVLFNKTKDPIVEIWDGKIIGQDEACKVYLADEAYPLNVIDAELPKYLVGKETLYYPIGLDQDFDLNILEWINSAKKNAPSKGYKSAAVTPSLQDILPLVHELRVLKDPEEIAAMRKAALISAQAHLKLMQVVKPGLMEYQLEAVFNEYCLSAGCRDSAYQAIVAGGNNACTLHYVLNDQQLKAGDLVLVDAGGEYEYYAADITRTFPVSGKFTDAQRQIYTLVLAAQTAGIEQVKPGNTFESIQDVMVEIIVTGLVELGIMHGTVKDLIAKGAYKKFYMHSSGHWLGLDVHDPGLYRVDNHSRKLQPGMVLTVEPGIYISNTFQDIDSQWLGIGVRIEDDILVTAQGHEVLSSAAPKTIAEIESARI